MSFNKWKEQLKEEKKVKRYQHLDRPLNLDCEKDFDYIVESIKNIKYHSFLPFIKKIKKQKRFKSKNGRFPVRSLKIRPIMYASHLDSHIYSYFNYILSHAYKKKLKDYGLCDNVIAYRSIKVLGSSEGKCNIHFAKEVFDYISSVGECIVITQDIKSFFDEISHKLLAQSIRDLSNSNWIDDDFYKVLNSLTSYKYINYDDFRKNNLKRLILFNRKIPIYQLLKEYFYQNKYSKGIPQGSPISGLLANIYLLKFDKELKSEFPSVFYRRYSDDLIFVCDEKIKGELLASINKKIANHKLSIQPVKTFVATFKYKEDMLKCIQVVDGNGKKENRDYVDYLGFEYNGENIYFRKNTYQKLLIKECISRKKRKRNSIKIKKRYRPKKLNVNKNNRYDYLKKALKVTDDKGIKIQINKFGKKLKSKLK